MHHHVRHALKENDYPSTKISIIPKKKPPSQTVSPEELVSMFFKMVEPSDTYQRFASKWKSITIKWSIA